MKIKFLLFLFLINVSLVAYCQYPLEVQNALKLTVTNKSQLVKALEYFYKTKDSLKIKSINFLISNMPIHNSYNYYWADSLNQKIEFNEFLYPSFKDAIVGFNDLKKKHSKLHPVPYSYRDIDSVKAEFLISNVELAIEKFRAKKNSFQINESDFLEYVLPYRTSIEPLQDWRKTYVNTFRSQFDLSEPSNLLLGRLKETLKDLFVVTWGIETRDEPLPRLGGLQLLSRGKGYCEDLADMVTLIARSQGIVATVDNVPVWGTTSGGHYLNYLKIDSTSSPHFDAIQDSLGREPGKVLRTTYSSQKDAIANWLDTSFIPKGFLRLKNYKDVTNEYWPTEDFSCQLFEMPNQLNQVVYATAFNTGNWRVTWYGSKHDKKGEFKNMSKGVVYLPMFYENNMLSPASWPYALGYNNKLILKPDKQNKRSITIREQEKFLKFRAAKTYRLYYWDNRWESMGDKVACEKCTELTYENVPKNALLLLIPEYSQGKERPFIILENGERIWF